MAVRGNCAEQLESEQRARAQRADAHAVLVVMDRHTLQSYVRARDLMAGTLHDAVDTKHQRELGTSVAAHSPEGALAQLLSDVVHVDGAAARELALVQRHTRRAQAAQRTPADARTGA